MSRSYQLSAGRITLDGIQIHICKPIGFQIKRVTQKYSHYHATDGAHAGSRKINKARFTGNTPMIARR